MLTAKSLKEGHVEIRQPNTYVQFKLYHDGYSYQVEKLLRTNRTYHIDDWFTYKAFGTAKSQFLWLYKSYKA